MSARFASREEVEKWDTLIAKNPKNSFFQHKSFLEFKATQKPSPWRVVYVVHTLSDKKPCYAAYLVKSVPTCGEYWYAPGGPLVDSVASLAQVTKQLKKLAHNAFVVLLEPPIPVNDQAHSAEVQARLTELSVASGVQPNLHTVRIDLTQSEADISASFKQRARRAIRQAQKAGVEVREVPASNETMKQMLRMYKETAKRAGFHIRSDQYYIRFWERYSDEGLGTFFFAYNNKLKTPVAGAFVLHKHEQALYKDGASVRGDSLPQGTLHLLQWEVMKWLKSRGVAEYDLHGAPASWLQDDANHRQHGLGVFKTSFGPISDTAGAFELVLKPRSYKLWQLFIRKATFTTINKRGGYFY